MSRRDSFLWAIVAEGATDRFLGRPRDACPYCLEACHSHEAWTYGWDEGGWLLEVRGMDEVRRWLRETA